MEQEEYDDVSRGVFFFYVETTGRRNDVTVPVSGPVILPGGVEGSAAGVYRMRHGWGTVDLGNKQVAVVYAFAPSAY